jgi:hypothetical protein
LSSEIPLANSRQVYRVACRSLVYQIWTDFPEPLTISDEELALIETYLSSIIAEMIETDLPDTELPRHAVNKT